MFLYTGLKSLFILHYMYIVQELVQSLSIYKPYVVTNAVAPIVMEQNHCFVVVFRCKKKWCYCPKCLYFPRHSLGNFTQYTNVLIDYCRQTRLMYFFKVDYI